MVVRILLFLTLLVLPSISGAATYYVDFDGGNDSNNGTATATPWKNIPGTRNAGNTAYLTATGWVTIQAGDTIWLKSGTTHDSTDGGRINISSNNYANGTSGSHITIKRKTDWGSGQIVIDGTGITTGSWVGLVNVTRQYVDIDGVVESGILIRDGAYYNLNAAFAGTSGSTFQNLEIYNSPSAGLMVQTSDKAGPTYMSGVTLRNIIAHTTTGTADTSATVYVGWLNDFVIDNVVAYDACRNVGGSCDGIHLSSSKNGWVINSTAYSNGEQGIDLSRDGDYKSRDDGYNITIRDCIGWNNGYGNFDQNSGYHDVYYIKNIGYRGTSQTTGNGDFALYQGTMGRNFWINNTSSTAHSWGFEVGWDWPYSSGYGLPAGSYDQVFINNNMSGGASYSLELEADVSSRVFNPILYNNNFYSVSGSNAAHIKSSSYTRANINAGSGGWPGTDDQAVDPLFVDSVGTVFSDVDLTLQSTSVLIDNGAFPYTTSGSGSGTGVTVTPLSTGMDATRVFRAGDSIQIEDAGTYTVSTVDNATHITLTGSATWSTGKGVWFPWAGAKPDIGAHEYGTAGASDTTPSSFTFTDNAGVERFAVVASDNMTVAGIDNGVSVSVTISGTGCEYSINGAAFTTATGSVVLLDNVSLHTTAGDYSATVLCDPVIGGLHDSSGYWAVTTIAAAEVILPPVPPRIRGVLRGGWR